MVYQVIRLSTSSYHEMNFIENEKSLLESISGVEYQFEPKNIKDLPTILISNSYTNFNEIPPELHHLLSFRQILGSVVSFSDLISLHVSELTLDRINGET